MRIIFFILMFFILSVGITTAKPVKIFGFAPEYKNATLTFQKYTDYISLQKLDIAKFDIDSLGNFSVVFDTDRTIEIFVLLGIYKAYIFVEPGGKYEVVLPPRQDKTLVHELNLYFEEEEISIGIKNANEKELNYLIFNFNNEYERFVSESFNWLYIFKDKKVVDSLEHALDSVFSNSKNQFFLDYKFYKYAILRHFVYERDRMLVTNKYLKDKPVLHDNPAYMHFLNQVWNNYIVSDFTTDFGAKLHSSIVLGKSPTMVYANMQQNIALRDPKLNELILLKCLNDAFANPSDFPRPALKQTLDSVALLTLVEQHKIMAKNIKIATETLEVGEAAFNFILPSKDSVLVSLDKFKGKFVYLCFCRSESYTCQQDYLLLKSIKEYFPTEIEIITISTDQDYNVFKEYLQRNEQFDWLFLYDKEKNQLKHNFNIKAIPSYFLIDPQGRLAIQPTLSPEQGFIRQFAQILAWKKRVEDAEKLKNEGEYNFNK
ncbi:MAG: redoxin domain-containing protein [Bacteroidales bacterium]|nr:redoxin domain-containing protein [Bacteroidales bacterium]